MFRHYLLFFTRRLLNNKIYSVINIAGLTLGLACVFFMIIYVENELSFDKYHEHADDTYRIIKYMPKYDLRDPNCPLPLASLVKDKLPEVQHAAPVRAVWPVYINKNEERLYIRQIYGSAEDIFEVLSFDFLYRVEGNLLDDPYDLV